MIVLRERKMSAKRTSLFVTILLTIAAIVILISLSRLLRQSPVSAGPIVLVPEPTASATGDEKQDSGSADKKDDPDNSLRRFMRQKLQASTLILEGLCTDDLSLVSDGAGTLLKMSHEEKWRVSNDMMYRRYSREFESAAEELQKEADAQDIHGSSLAWVNVTMKCLKCHEWVRNTVIADSEVTQD